jgi:hypothetical protein
MNDHATGFSEFCSFYDQRVLISSEMYVVVPGGHGGVADAHDGKSTMAGPGARIVDVWRGPMRTKGCIDDHYNC